MTANLAQAGTFRLPWWRTRVVYLVSIAVFAGIAIMTGTLTSFGTWLLQNVPIFQYLVV